MKKKLSNEELITFCGQMALILKSGISSLEGIYIMEDGDVQTEGREILKEIREELEMCGMLYPAMEKTGVFPEYALHMTEIGEQTGRLDETMEALAAYYQREEEILDAVKSAVTYPVAMLGMLLVIVAVLFIKVMPVFEQVYMQLGQEMTGVARQLLNIGDWMRQSAIVLVVLAVVILIIVFFFIFYKKARIEFISKIQTIGFMKKIAWKRARTRFAGGMAMALKSGLDMDESLSLSEKLTDYEPLKMKIQQCQEQMKQGETFPKALKETRIFDGMQERLMIIGYETGAVDEVMEQAADLYQKQLQDQIQKMIAVLEPTLVGILCVIVGIILLSVMLPLVGIMAGIG
ncbi:MAG: type II secretion system F family protein [Lachnospiraceae bacterium]|nr:type II secretion system F family protein [Lachnospiraceae bacterium]